jgi:hypothetical protein
VPSAPMSEGTSQFPIVASLRWKDSHWNVETLGPEDTINVHNGRFLSPPPGHVRLYFPKPTTSQSKSYFPSLDYDGRQWTCRSGMSWVPVLGTTGSPVMIHWALTMLHQIRSDLMTFVRANSNNWIVVPDETGGQSRFPHKYRDSIQRMIMFLSQQS